MSFLSSEQSSQRCNDVFLETTRPTQKKSHGISCSEFGSGKVCLESGLDVRIRFSEIEISNKDVFVEYASCVGFGLRPNVSRTMQRLLRLTSESKDWFGNSMDSGLISECPRWK